MALDKHISTQTAVLLAGALIAAAVFFGLRSREPAPPAPAPRPSAVSDLDQILDPPPAPPRPSAAPPSTPPPAETMAPDRAAVLAAARKELERHRTAVVEACVKPALEKQPQPPTIKLTFNITFDAQGKQVMRGVVEDRATMREGVSMCAMQAIPVLALPMQLAAPISVEVPWVLP